MWKSMNQRFKFKESDIISKNFMQWGLEAMEKDLQQQYLDTESNSRLFFDTFFELCRKFNIQYSIATTQEKAFIDEVTEFIEYSARDCAPQPLKLSIHSGGIEHPCRCR